MFPGLTELVVYNRKLLSTVVSTLQTIFFSFSKHVVGYPSAGLYA